MTRNTAGSSDVDAARALSRRLSGLETGPEPADATGTPYIRFAAAVDEDASPPAAAEVAALEPLNDFNRWDEFLAWSLEKVRSTAAFAVDPQGFVIGSSGNVPEDGFEGTGAELSYVMSQADAMDPTMGALRAVGLEFSNRRVAGFRAETEGAEGFIVAFIDAERFNETTRQQIARQLEHSFGVLL
jgi:hypothetical protein